MPTIQCLDSHVADLIAAGEVVERPASVAKELLETPWMPGATAISVEVRSTGPHPFTHQRQRLRHRTRSAAHGLPAPRHQQAPPAGGSGSHRHPGLPGEALAAIAAVSRVDIFSREKGADQGADLHLEGGVPGGSHRDRLPRGHHHLRPGSVLQHPRPHEIHEEGHRRGSRRSRALSPIWP